MRGSWDTSGRRFQDMWIAQCAAGVHMKDKHGVKSRGCVDRRIMHQRGARVRVMI